MTDRIDQKKNKDTSDEYQKLAVWLKEILTKRATPPSSGTSITSNADEFEDTYDNHYHLHFYQELPDFAIALLKNDPEVNKRFAPLLYHLLICPTCHGAYLEIYSAMRTAIETGKLQPPGGQTTPLSLELPPDRIIVHLCKVLISQAEAVLRQARRDHTDGDPLARSLLQQALRISAQVAQSGVRSQALEDLVQVATLFDGAGTTSGPAAHCYSPSLIGTGGARHGKTLRRAEPTLRQAETPTEEPTIHLRDRHLEGWITQHGDILELHLEDLDKNLRGHHITISVPLGSLFEPIRWLGGNPLAIHSSAPVAEDGTLVTPVGETTLRITNPDERSLLEVTFWRLEVRPTS